ncbi:hypothetical protein BsWGS_27846 [Bradybaena similaris]
MKMCDNIDEELVKQELSDVLCEGTSQRFSTLVNRAACSTILEMAWQSETQEVIENSCNTSLKDENCHISENVSSAIEQNNVQCLSNEKCMLQNVGTPLKHTQMPAKPVDNIFVYDSYYPGRMQTEETPYMSGVCVSIANVGGNSRRIALSHTEQQACNSHDCGAGFVEAGCHEHHERKQARKKLRKCDFCGASFARSRYLTLHKRTHTGEKPYKCDICEASFTHGSGLIYHNLKHTGERPYKCDFCEASFAHSSHLTCHKRTHTGEKPYQCDVCEASFAQSSNLTCHKRTHTGEKPYKCDVCEASFAQSSHLKSHKRTHTGENP